MSGRTLCGFIATMLCASGAWAAEPTAAMPNMPGMDHANMPGMDHANMPGMTHDAGEDHAAHMAGALGIYAGTRDASGTSWQPEATPMEGVHGQLGDWSTMLHGFVDLIADNQGGPRGDDKVFSASMFMAMAQRAVSGGELTLRSMLSLDPLMGKDGYPLLFQTGETADGATPLIDRQHPHDFFMELAASYGFPLAIDRSVFFYAGYPGEPALGPPTFMHRFSGMDNPEAPIGHHWLDSTHITFGVLTAGIVLGDWKVEGSVFNGREPDEHRWDFDALRLDSGSVRVSVNPSPQWALQASWGYLHRPEGLEPDVDQRRTTVSAMYTMPLEGGAWQTTLAWGMNDKAPGAALQAFLLESALHWDRHTLFGRAENDEKDELFESGPLAGRTFRVSKLSLGYIYDLPVGAHLKWGFGGLGSVYGIPAALEPAYRNPTSYMLFTRLGLR